MSSLETSILPPAFTARGLFSRLARLRLSSHPFLSRQPQPVVFAFDRAFPAVPFDDPKALFIAIGTSAHVCSLVLRVDEGLYQAIRFAGSVYGCRIASRISDSLARPPQVLGKSPAFFEREA
jgi:hypothetical protein